MTVATLAPAEKTYDDHVRDLMQISRHIVSHNVPRAFDTEEALADAFAEIPGIIAKWDPSKGALSSIAYQRLRGAMIDGHRTRTKYRTYGTAYKNTLSIEALSHAGDPDRWDSSPYEGWQPKTRDVADHVVGAVYAEWVINRLHLLLDNMKNQRNAEICRQYWFDERSLLDIATEHGVTESRACQIVNAVRKKIRTIIEKD